MAHIGNAPFGKTVRTVTSETLTSVKTAFYPTGGYIVGYVDVYVNGVRLTEAADFTATDGTTVTLLYNPSIGDTVDVVTYGSIELANAVRRDGDTLVGTLFTRALVPTANITYDIGTSTMRYKDLYLSGNTINLGDIKLSTNGTAFSVANTTGGVFASALGNTVVTGTLTANATTITGNVSVTGNATLTGTLTTNSHTMVGDLTVTGNQFVNGAVTIANSTSNTVVFATSGNISIGNQTVADRFSVTQNDATGPSIRLQSTTANSWINQWGNTGGGSGRTNRFEINASATNMSLAGGSFINFEVGGVGDTYEKMRIDSAGLVTKPYQVAFQAYNGAAYTINGTDSICPLDTLSWQVGTGYSTTNKRFTAPVAGRYLFTFVGTMTSNGDHVYNAIYYVVNGSGTAIRMRMVATAAASDWGGITGAVILTLAQNDYVELSKYTDGSNTITAPINESRWCGYLLG